MQIRKPVVPKQFFLNTFPFFFGKMSLPQTVYFSISNFFYKLTQPTVHVCNAVGVDDFHWLRICILLQLKLKLVSLIYSKLLFKTFWQFKFRCQYSSWVTHSKCMCKIVHYVYLHIVLRKQNSGVYSMKNSPIECTVLCSLCGMF